MMKILNQLVFLFISLFFSYSSHAQFAQQIGQDIHGEDPEDFSGNSLAISDDGETILIGSSSNDGGGNNAGSVRVYILQNGQWVQKGFDIDGSNESDLFGESVACNFDGSRIAISSTWNDDAFNGAGHVKVFDWNGFFWDQVGSNIEGDTFGASFGVDLELTPDGQTLIVGSQYAENANGDGAGSVRVFDFDGTEWIQRGMNLNGSMSWDNYGFSVAITPDGSTLVLGSPGNDDQSSSAGLTQVFDWDGMEWIQRGDNIYGEEETDRSGTSVDISDDGNTIIMGAPNNDDNPNSSGQIRVYEWLGSFWFNKGQDVNPGNQGTSFGDVVKLSADGNIFATSSEFYDNVLGNEGVVVFYKFDGDQWNPFGQAIFGEDQNDYSGEPFAMTPGVSRIIISAPTNDDGGTNAGEVKVYDLVQCSPQINALSISACDSYDLPSGNGTVFSSGIYTDTVLTNFGCDSILEIDLTLSTSSQSNIDVTECGQYTWSLNGNIYGSSGTFIGVGTNQNGCDSLVTLNLTILEASEHVSTIDSCEPYFWDETQSTYNQSGVYSESYQGANGCDSILTLDLTINELDLTVSISDQGLEVNPADEIQWLDCNNNFVQISGANSTLFSPSSLGSYAALITEGNCTDTTLCFMFEPIGIFENNLEDLDIYPVPSTGEIFISSTDFSQLNAIHMFNSEGRKVNSFANENLIQSSANRITLNIERKGLFLLQFIFEDKIIMKQVIVE